MIKRYESVAGCVRRWSLLFGVHDCDGFSQSGGPWITPERSMKKLIWTATDMEGPRPFDGALPRGEILEDFYRDVAVIAFPLPRWMALTGPGRDVEVRGRLVGISSKNLALRNTVKPPSRSRHSALPGSRQ